MKKRLQAILAAFMVVFLLLADCTPIAGAVAPIALVEAALVSYVASTGYKLYIDNGTGGDLLSLFNDLYEVYLETHPETMTLALLAQGNFVYNDNSGNIVVTQTAANIFQDFSDWIQTNYSVPVDDQETTVVFQSQLGNYTFPEYTKNPVYVSSLPDTREFFYFVLSTLGRPVSLTDSQIYTINNLLSEYSAVSIHVYQGEGDVSYSSGFFNVTFMNPVLNANNYSPGGYGLYFHTGYCPRGQPLVFDSYDVFNNVQAFSGMRVNGNYVDFSSINAVAGSASAGLAVSLGQNILDKAADILAGESLIIDVGADVGDTAEEIVQTVVAGYDSITGTIPVTDTIVATEVIDTPVYDYPDVDNLGLPELGLALVERFPFCIPYDFVHLISIFEEEPEAPYISIDIFPDSFKQKLGITGNTAFVLDLSSETWAWIGTVSRWASLIGFCLIMFTLTKRLIWTS